MVTVLVNLLKNTKLDKNDAEWNSEHFGGRMVKNKAFLIKFLWETSEFEFPLEFINDENCRKPFGFLWFTNRSATIHLSV